MSTATAFPATPAAKTAATGETRASTEGPEVTKELKQAVLVTLLKIKAEHGQVTASDVRDAARVAGCSTRTVWRWVAAGSVPTDERGAWTPPEDFRALLLRHGGSIAALHDNLVAEGRVSVSTRTMQRAIARSWPTAHLTFMRGGFKAAQGHLPTTAMPDLPVNGEWSMDDTQIPIWCVLPSGEIGKPWMQGVLDACTRHIMSLTLKPEPFITEDAIENLANAVAGHYTPDGVFIGGKPQALRTDRGSIFVSHATSMGLIASSIDRRYSEAYTPQQNGKIERWHQFKKRLRTLPGFDWHDYKQGDPRKAHTPPPVDQLLTYEEVVVEVLREVRVYNTERVHSAHGMTPQARWEQEVERDPDAVVPADMVALRAAARQSETRKLRRRRVSWENRFYNLHPQSVGETEEDPEIITARRRLIDAAEGRTVTLRFLRGRHEYVSVYNDRQQYLGDAVWDQIQTVAQAGETAATRRQHIKTMTADIESITIADAQAVAARRQQVLEDLAAEGLDFSLYDTGENDPDQHDPRPDAAPDTAQDVSQDVGQDDPDPASPEASAPSNNPGPRGGGSPGGAARARESAAGSASTPRARARDAGADIVVEQPPRSRTQRAADQRRRDALDAATWVRPGV